MAIQQKAEEKKETAKPVDKKDEKVEAPKPKARKAPKEKKPMTEDQKRKAVLGVTAVACLAVGGVVGAVAFGGGSNGAPTALKGQTEVSESDLDQVVATAVIDGKVTDITAREAIQATSTLTKNDDGKYAAPTADGALAAARTKAVRAAADKEGVKVTDDDITAYAKKNLGSDDLKSLASSYGYDESQLKQVISDSVLMQKLYKAKTGKDSADATSAPTQPDQGKAASDYSAYIKEVAGDAFDADKGTFSDDGWKEAMKDQKVGKDDATYDAAEAAYTYAYQQWSKETTATQKKWSDWTNGVYKDVSIAIATTIS